MARSLKVELRGDRWKGRTFPALRVMGQWMAAAGFVPGRRVSVEVVASGEIKITQQSVTS